MIESIHYSIIYMGKDKALENKWIKNLLSWYNIRYRKNNAFMWDMFIKNLRFYKQIPFKQIIMDRQKQQYVIDLTYLPKELCKNTNIKYILNILDHFSKFLISYLIAKKIGKIIC